MASRQPAFVLTGIRLRYSMSCHWRDLLRGGEKTTLGFFSYLVPKSRSALHLAHTVDRQSSSSPRLSFIINTYYGDVDGEGHLLTENRTWAQQASAQLRIRLCVTDGRKDVLIEFAGLKWQVPVRPGEWQTTTLDVPLSRLKFPTPDQAKDAHGPILLLRLDDGPTKVIH